MAAAQAPACSDHLHAAPKPSRAPKHVLHACAAVRHPVPERLPQGFTHDFAPNVTVKLPGGTRLAFQYTRPFIPGNVPASLRLRIPGEWRSD